MSLEFNLAEVKVLPAFYQIYDVFAANAADKSLVAESIERFRKRQVSARIIDDGKIYILLKKGVRSKSRIKGFAKGVPSVHVALALALACPENFPSRHDLLATSSGLQFQVDVGGEVLGVGFQCRPSPDGSIVIQPVVSAYRRDFYPMYWPQGKLIQPLALLPFPSGYLEVSRGVPQKRPDVLYKGNPVYSEKIGMAWTAYGARAYQMPLRKRYLEALMKILSAPPFNDWFVINWATKEYRRIRTISSSWKTFDRRIQRLAPLFKKIFLIDVRDKSDLIQLNKCGNSLQAFAETCGLGFQVQVSSPNSSFPAMSDVIVLADDIAHSSAEHDTKQEADRRFGNLNLQAITQPELICRLADTEKGWSRTSSGVPSHDGLRTILLNILSNLAVKQEIIQSRLIIDRGFGNLSLADFVFCAWRSDDPDIPIAVHVNEQGVLGFYVGHDEILALPEIEEKWIVWLERADPSPVYRSIVLKDIGVRVTPPFVEGQLTSGKNKGTRSIRSVGWSSLEGINVVDEIGGYWAGPLIKPNAELYHGIPVRVLEGLSQVNIPIAILEAVAKACSDPYVHDGYMSAIPGVFKHLREFERMGIKLDKI